MNKTNLPSIPSIALFTTAAILGSALGADASIVIFGHTNDRVLRDTSNPGDNVGNAAGNLPPTTAAVGETGTDNDQSRYFLPFGVLTAEQITAIANAPNVPGAITLNISLGEKTNVSGFNVDIYGFTNRTQIGGFISDYQNLSVTLLHANAVTASTPNGFLSFDITGFAKNEIANENTILAFRFQANPGNIFPIMDTIPNRYLFHTADHATNKPFIEVIPEPSTYALFGGFTVLAAALIRRRAKKTPSIRSIC